MEDTEPNQPTEPDLLGLDFGHELSAGGQKSEADYDPELDPLGYGSPTGILTQEQIRNRIIDSEGSTRGEEKDAAPGVRTYWASESEQMVADRKAFVAQQKGICCRHGLPYVNSDGEITTAEFVDQYRLCTCCSTIRKHPEFEAGHDLYCAVCAAPELEVEGIQEPEAQRELLEAAGWIKIDLEAARSLNEHDLCRSWNSVNSIESASSTGEDLWYNPEQDRLNSIRVKEDEIRDAEDRRQYAKKFGVELKGLPPRTEEWHQEAKEVLGTTAILARMAWERYRDLFIND